MTKEDVFEQLQPYGCVSVYITGSTANPYIKNPRDLEFIAVFETEEKMKKAPYIYNVHKYYKNGVPGKFYNWAYEYHYINQQTPIGEIYHFTEPKISELVKICNHIIKYNSQFLKKKMKQWYYVAMVKAIEKYGYDSIPEKVVNQINDLHDLKITYDQFELEK